jgi:hypothetical protein
LLNDGWRLYKMYDSGTKQIMGYRMMNEKGDAFDVEEEDLEITIAAYHPEIWKMMVTVRAMKENERTYDA